MGLYRGLLRTRRSNGKTQGIRPQQLDLNGSNGQRPVARAEPLLASFEADPNSEVPL